ncbi:MAG: CoA pyrophosphatase, partial [Planctomycetota bacterium]
VLTRRPTTLRHHGGQICLPGGQVEAGETALAASLREFQEELGAFPVVRATLGMLRTQYVYASDNMVDPLVVWIEKPAAPFDPDPAEVDEVFDVPLDELMRQSSGGSFGESVERRPVHLPEEVEEGLEFSKPGFYVDGRHIWGATAMILDELAHHLLHSLPEAASPAN